MDGAAGSNDAPLNEPPVELTEISLFSNIPRMVSPFGREKDYLRRDVGREKRHRRVSFTIILTVPLGIVYNREIILSTSVIRDARVRVALCTDRKKETLFTTRRSNIRRGNTDVTRPYDTLRVSSKDSRHLQRETDSPRL